MPAPSPTGDKEVLFSLSIPNFETTLAEATALTRTLALPIADLKPLLLKQLKVKPEEWEQLDLTKPAALVVMRGEQGTAENVQHAKYQVAVRGDHIRQRRSRGGRHRRPAWHQSGHVSQSRCGPGPEGRKVLGPSQGTTVGVVHRRIRSGQWGPASHGPCRQSRRQCFANQHGQQPDRGDELRR